MDKMTICHKTFWVVVGIAHAVGWAMGAVVCN